MTIDFEDVALNGGGFNAFGNGTRFGIARFASLTLGADTDLFAGGVDTGLDGTFLVGLRGGSGTDVRPGGVGGPGDPEDDDDFEMSFDSPVTAVSFLILNNRAEDGESITVFAGENVIASVKLPGGDTVRFWGIVLDPSDPPITSLEVLEGLETGVGSELDDDIAFDEVGFVRAPACDDAIDNDQDGLTDFLDDPECDDASDDNEDLCEPPVVTLKGARDVSLRNTTEVDGRGSTAVKSVAVSATLASTGPGGDCPDGTTREVAISFIARDDSFDEFFTPLPVSADRKGNPLTVTAGAKKAAQAKFQVPLTAEECGIMSDPGKPEIRIGQIEYLVTVDAGTSSASQTQAVGITCKP